MIDVQINALLDLLRSITGIQQLHITESNQTMENMKKIMLQNGKLILWCPNDLDYKVIVQLKRFLDMMTEVIGKSIENEKAKDMLQYDVVKLFKGYQEQLEGHLNELSFRFLHENTSYALLDGDRVLNNQGLDEHTIQTSAMKLNKINEFEVNIKNGTLYGLAIKGYKVIVLTEDLLSEVEKGLINIQLILIHNNSERDNYIKALQKNKAMLERQDALRNEFLANTSHELRTPIHGIIGLAESLIEGAAGSLNTETIKNLEMITMSGKRLEQMVEDVLDFSMLKNNQVTLDVMDIDFHELLNVVLTVLGATLGKKKIQLINATDQDVYIKADENRVQQILYNLIGNAIKFTEEGYVKITAKANDGFYEICVEDTGIGVPEDKLGSIFRAFEQADGSISRVYGGTGLGLSITKFLVELHGGRVWCESIEEKGSKFYFILPSATEVEISHLGESDNMKPIYTLSGGMSDDKKDKNASQRNDDRERILIVDDDQVNRQILVNQLKLDDYNIDTASNGLSALEMIETFEYDLILLDIMMPKLSGYEVCKIIRRKYSRHELPILILTARNQPKDIVTGLSVGANDYLTKPFQKAEMLSRVRTLLELKKSVEDAIQSALLANTDVLTKIGNRRHLYEKGYELFEKAVLDKKHISVLMLDIDYLKTINDSYGHNIGDKAIRAVAKGIRDVIREIDVVGRYGGEEFVAILPNTDKTYAIEIANRILNKIRSLRITTDKDIKIKITVSIGVASLSNHKDLDDLIKEADQYLYCAKNEGRNRVVGQCKEKS